MQTGERRHLDPARHGWHACVLLDGGTAEAWHHACPLAALAMAIERARAGMYIPDRQEQRP